MIYFWFSVVEHSLDFKNFIKSRTNKKVHTADMHNLTRNDSNINSYELLNEYEKPPKIICKNNYDNIDEYGLTTMGININDDINLVNELYISLSRKIISENPRLRGLPAVPVNKQYDYSSSVDGDESNLNRLSLSIVNGMTNSLSRTLGRNPQTTTSSIVNDTVNTLNRTMNSYPHTPTLSFVNETVNTLNRTMNSNPHTPTSSDVNDFH